MASQAGGARLRRGGAQEREYARPLPHADAGQAAAAQATEPKPPAGVAPVHWMLLTSEPIDTPEAIARMVDIVDARWTIEELFKALKTGCQFEKQQLDDADSLFRALSLYWPGRCSRCGVMRAILTETQRALLSAHPEARLPKKPSAWDWTVAVARLGGFLNKGGPPGWLTLGRGLLALRQLEIGAQLAQALQSLRESHL